MIHRPLLVAIFGLLALTQAVLAAWLALRLVQMLLHPERYEYADASVGIALAGAVAFSVTTIFSARAASAMWKKWKTGRRKGGPSPSASDGDQTE